MLGRLVVSQNAKQKRSNNYSYTLYDYLGRITEVGQLSSSDPMTAAKAKSPVQMESWVNAAATTRVEVTRTVYDLPHGDINNGTTNTPPVLIQTNLRNRVSYSEVYPSISSINSLPSAATYYTYDIHGNVNELVQDFGAGSTMATAMNRFKRMQYSYDLISGKVNEVLYQPGEVDAFYHKYFYDAENRIIRVSTSRDRIIWEDDARYSYYRHGPLARTELGHLKVQGMDYAYTLQGWLKGVNSTSLDPLHDMGKDGISNSTVAKDVLGFALHYNDDDYTKIYTTVTSPFAAGRTVLRNLYNGNIGGMSVNIGKLNQPLYYNYRYDQLNRLTEMDAYDGFNTGTNEWNNSTTVLPEYRERVKYDANGNIYNYERNGASGQTAMDDMTYWYYYQSNELDNNTFQSIYKTYRAHLNRLPRQGEAEYPSDLVAFTNRLASVQDAVTAGNYTEDIDNQVYGYEYDEIGNLVQDLNEGINSIEWNVYGKIKKITKGSVIINYAYDASGNRIMKDVAGQQTWYVRDASGNVMSIYNKDVNASQHLVQTELHLYGSSRLGIFHVNQRVENVVDNSIYLSTLPERGLILPFERGSKRYELSNHLGNVLVTISDRRIPITLSGSLIDHYEAEVISANDYYPFGMMMPGRKFWVDGSYRYGFNGAEIEDLLFKDAYDLGLRIYDSRLGRMFSIDPLANDYPWQSPFAYHRNNPIAIVDHLGGGDPPTKPERNSTTVKPGESLWSIAKKELGEKASNSQIQNRVNQLIEINKLNEKGIIHKGQTIFLESEDVFKSRLQNYFQEKKKYDRHAFETIPKPAGDPRNQYEARPGAYIDKEGNFL